MRKKWINKLIYGLTLTLPLSLAIIIPAILFNITPDIVIKGANANELTYMKFDDHVAFYDFYGKDDINIKGDTLYRADIKQIVIPIYEDDIVKFDDGYFKLDLSIDEFSVFIDYEDKAIKKEQSWKVPVAFIVAGVTIALFIIPIVSKNMTWHYKRPRLAVLVALIIGTAILAIINAIVGNMLRVFVVFTISWIAYMVEYYQLTKEDREIQDKKEIDEVEQRIKELRKRL